MSNLVICNIAQYYRKATSVVYASPHVCVYTCLGMHMFLHMYICVRVHGCEHTCICVCVCRENNNLLQDKVQTKIIVVN